MNNGDEDILHVATLDDLPLAAFTGVRVWVDDQEYNRLFIFNGYKWIAESDEPGDTIQFAHTVLPRGTLGPADPQRTDVLDEAWQIIHGERADDYGDKHESFHRIAMMWSAYLGMGVNSVDVANLMILLKVSRARNKYKRDSYVDIAGYAALAEMLRTPQND